MANILHDIKDTLNPSKGSSKNQPSGGSSERSEEQTFNILPHPAKTNDPADIQQPSEQTGGLRSSQGPFEAFKSAPGPVRPNDEMLGSLPPAKSREELSALQAQLNK